jgi:predicted TIM-barrel fold metal-dependent hydrolase
VRSYDIHQHFWPEPYVQVLRQRRTPPRIEGDRLELAIEGASPFNRAGHTLQERIAELDRDGIDVGVISLPATMEIHLPPDREAAEMIEAYHEGILETVRDSGGRLQALAVNACREGFVGASVAAADLVDPPGWLDRLLSELEASDRILFVHPGTPRPPDGRPPWWSAVVEYTAQMQAAYAAWIADQQQAHPRLEVVFAILAGGAPIQLERLHSRGVGSDQLVHPNIYFDTASYGRHALELTMRQYGVGQLLYGTDVPVIDAAVMRAELASLGDDLSSTLCRENPARLLG